MKKLIFTEKHANMDNTKNENHSICDDSMNSMDDKLERRVAEIAWVEVVEE